MAFDPNSIDPENVRQLILGHLKITHPDGTVVDFGRVETSNDLVLAAQELRQTLFAAEAKLGICCRLDQALTEFKRSISVIGCCGDSWKP